MNIFILTSELYPLAGGIANYVKNFSEALVRAGHQVVVFGFTEDANHHRETTINGVRIVRLKKNLLSFPYTHMSGGIGQSYQMAEAVIEYIQKQGKPDVIESQECLALSYFLLQRKLQGEPALENVPIVLVLHTAQYQARRVNGFPEYRLPVWWVGCLEKWCILAADGIVAPSRFILEKTQTELKTALNQAAVIPYPLTLDLQQLIPIPTPGDVVYFGRYEVRKGVVELLKECQKLWDAGVDFRLTLIGNSTPYILKNCDMKDYITREYRWYIDDGRLVLEPVMGKPDLYQRVAQAWCVVIPSLWENFPNVCMEAMLLQKVVLASSNGGMKEMIHYADKPAGFVFDWQQAGDFAAKLQHILNLSETENLSIGQQARETILQMCGPERIVSLRVAHFERVIESSRGQVRRVYPSLNYKPTGKIDYPPPVEPLGVLGRLSVCIPYYNMGRYIRETLDSVYQVNYSDLEVLIWDDGSTELESIHVLTQVEKEYPGLTVYRSANQGLAGARNSLAQVATGEFIAFLDADDRVHPDYYSKAVQILQRYDNVGIVSAWVQHFGDYHGCWVTWQTELPYLLCHNMITSAVVVRRAAYLQVGGQKMEMSRLGGFEDWESFINFNRNGWLGVVIPEFYFLYRIREGSMYRSLSLSNHALLGQWISVFHDSLYQQYGTEIFNLCNQNEISPIHWTNPTKSYYLPTVGLMARKFLSKVANRLGLSPKLRYNLKRLIYLLSYYRAKLL
ncbi:MAG: glycosyltransferase [Gloeomargarita sp. GXS_bins_116]